MIHAPRRRPLLALSLVATSALAAARCSGPTVTPPGDETGGSTGSGGSTATGGSQATGGKGAGGSKGSGGSTGSGGSSATGGSTGSGGSGSGGSASGGSQGSGGSGTGGAGTGGATGGSGGGGGVGTVVDPPCNDQIDHVAPSINPPGGLAANTVPMFVLLGFDDNGHADGINWVLDNLRTRKNADGSAARATFFISAGFASDFFNPAGGQNATDLLSSWRKIKADGHEIGNHSWSHADTLSGASEATWQTELQKANDLFVNTLGVEKCKLWGFRTPFLLFSQSTFDAIKATGLRYDASIEFGYDWWMPAGAANGWGPGTSESGKHYYWPFTLDNPLPSGFYGKGIMPSPGLWEIPVYTFNKISGDTATTVTGLDYNLWLKVQTDAATFTATLKDSLDQRLAGNRSPFSLGGHTDIYSQFDASTAGWADYQARRKALSNFIDYALSKPEVRFVTFRQLIAWMRKPTPL